MKARFFYIIICFSLLTTTSSIADEVFVKETGSGDLSGKDWDNAFPGDSLVRLVYRSLQGTTIYVAEGSYSPYYAIYQNNGRKLMYDKDCAFIIPQGVSIFGGYPSQSTGKSLDGRNPELYQTTLNGDMGCAAISDQTVIPRNGSVLDGCYIDGNFSSAIRDFESDKTVAFLKDDILYIKSEEEINSALLYDIMGRPVYISKSKFYNVEVPLYNKQADRIFILVLVFNGKTVVRKL